MHIQFIFPTWTRLLEDYPHLEESLPAYKIGSFRMAGLGIPTAVGALPAGHTFTVVDENTGPVNLETGPDLVGISFFTPQAARAYQIADEYRRRGVPVIGGGIHPSMAPDDTLNHFDSVVCGPVEALWPEILSDLAGAGLKQRYSSEGPQSFAQPHRDVFKNSAYLRSDIVQTARGCTLGCPFCVVPACYGSSIQFKPVDAVVEDIATLTHSTYYLADENLLFGDEENREYSTALLDAMISAGPTRRFLLAAYPFMLRQLGPEFTRLLAQAGCSQIYLVLGLKQPLSEELKDGEIGECIRQLRSAGIQLMTTFTLGNDQDPPDVEPLIVDFCRRSRVNLVEFTLRTPFPGTPFFDDCEQTGRLLTRDWARFNGANVVFQPVGQSAEELQERYLNLWLAHYKGYSNFEMNKRYMRGFGRRILDPE